MTDGEWWRKSGPWSERAGASDASGASVPASPASSASSAEGAAAGGPAEDSVYGPSAASGAGGAGGGIPNVSLDLPGVAGPGGGSEVIPPPTVQSSSPWTMTMLDFSDTPQPAPKAVPEQRTAEEAQQQSADRAGAKPSNPKRQRKAEARAKAKTGDKAAPAAGAGAGRGARKPSPLILLSCGLLVGGAVSGFFPAMLAGWGLGYLTRQLSDVMRKFVILGIPLITMTATTLFAMNHAKQAGGGAVQPGSPLGQFSWSMAPGVLRTAAVATAVVLLLLSLRRRPPQQG
ncbi:hypothetical protein [Kitasatospora sp. NPDC017646]|uniref:hypothetical protein n=1 Tax=Kitasatospora sp. NPDC017646 TaxID=3364024 RepID=UPI0037BC1686